MGEKGETITANARGGRSGDDPRSRCERLCAAAAVRAPSPRRNVELTPLELHLRFFFENVLESVWDDYCGSKNVKRFPPIFQPFPPPPLCSPLRLRFSFAREKKPLLPSGGVKQVR